MTPALQTLVLVIAIQGILSAGVPCSGDIKARTRDGVTCFECGKSKLANPTEQGSSAGKLPASLGDFPWSAAIYWYFDDGWDQVCGGTLISSQAVLTSASCATTRSGYRPGTILDVKDIRVILGTTNRSWNTTESSAIKRQVKEIRLHPDHKGRSVNFASDIALLFLDAEVPFSSDVMPACLDYNLNQLPLYKKDAIGFVSGFGYKDECGASCPRPSEKLMYSRTKVLSFDQCFNITQTLSPTSISPMTSDKLCIGDSSASPIQRGDLGGGFTLISEDLHYVTGVANMKIYGRTGSGFIFGTLINVSRYMEWLKSNLPEK